MNDIIAKPIEKEIRKCLCCGNEFKVEPFVIQDFCNRCYSIVVREVFNKENGNLTLKELKDKIKNMI